MKKKRGFIGIGNIIFIFLAGFFLFVLFKVAPTYFEYMNIRSILNDYVASEEVKGRMNPQTILQAIARRFDVNGIPFVPENCLITSDLNNGFQIEIKYEKRIFLIGNVDLVLSFDQKVATHPREQT